MSTCDLDGEPNGARCPSSGGLPRALGAEAFAGLSGADLDSYLLRLILAHAAGEARPLAEALGLEPGMVDGLLARHWPEAAVGWGVQSGTSGEEAPEEADLRALLVEHRAGRDEVEIALAAIVARRSLSPNHLWQDMGFTHRRELNAFFRRFFPALATLNAEDMKWKKFFYRQLCAREGLTLCKSPNCEVCDDFAQCFGTEDGEPLTTLAHLARG